MPSIAGLDRPAHATTPAFRDADSAFWPLAGIAILLIAQATIIVTRAINWDEFYHFGLLYDLANGRTVPALQTLWTRAFAWLTDIPGDTIDRIQVGRTGLFLCEIVTLVMIFAVARRFTDRTGAMLCALAYLSAGYVMQHGFSFRPDPMVTAVLMTALALLLWRNLNAVTVLLVGALLGLSGMLTLKAVLYAAAFAGVAWLRWTEDGRTVRTALKLAAIPVVSAAVFAVVHQLHAGAMAGTVAPGPGVAASTDMASGAGRYVFFLGIPNNSGFIVGFISISLALFALIVAFPFALKRADAGMSEKIAMAAMFAIVLTPAFYENTAPYYYVFMLAPVAAACAVSVGMIRQKAPAMVLTALMVSLAASVVFLENREIIHHQKRIDRTAMALFDQPVAYFDHADALPALNKRNGFLMPWGLKGYLAAGQPRYRQAMEREPVPLVLANWHPFNNLFHGDGQYFLPADAKALRENYVQFAGPIWLAGKTVAAGSRNDSAFLVPGPYTVRDASLVIDGVEHQPGEVVTLGRGQHDVTNPGPVDARLIWGNRLEAIDPLDFSGTWVRF